MTNPCSPRTPLNYTQILTVSAAAVILIWILGLLGVDVPDPVSAAFAVLIAAAAGYLMPQRSTS